MIQNSAKLTVSVITPLERIFVQDVLPCQTPPDVEVRHLSRRLIVVHTRISHGGHTPEHIGLHLNLPCLLMHKLL